MSDSANYVEISQETSKSGAEFGSAPHLPHNLKLMELL